jgi:hypothetical protein
VPLRNYYADKIREMYMMLAASRGRYLMGHGRCADAERYFAYSLTFQPAQPAPPDDPATVNVGRIARQVAAWRDECRNK